MAVVKVTVARPTGPQVGSSPTEEFLTTEAGLQYCVEDGVVSIFVDGPEGREVQFDIPIDEAAKDVIAIAMLITHERAKSYKPEEGFE